MPDFTDLVSFVDKTRWLLFQACATPGVDADKFASDMGMSKEEIRDILFSRKGDIRDMGLREIAHWFYFTIGRTPEFSMEPLGAWHSRERPQ